MTREEAIAAFEEIKIKFKDDVEAQGCMAEDVLLELLKSLGFDDVVDAYSNVPRWYA